MRPAIVDEFDPPFTVTEPSAQTIPFVFNVPHAGAVYPASFLAASRLDAVALRRSEDAFVDELFGAMTGLGISEEEARQLEHEFTSGRAIVAVKAGPRAAEAAEIMRRHGGYDIQNRRHSPIQTEGVFSEP